MRTIIILLTLTIFSNNLQSQIINPIDKSGYDYYGDIVLRYNNISEDYLTNEKMLILDSLAYRMKHFSYEFYFTTKITCYCGKAEEVKICKRRYKYIRQYLNRKHSIKNKYIVFNIDSINTVKDIFLKDNIGGFIHIVTKLDKRLKNPYKIR